MTSSDPRSASRLLAAYRAELLRWNRQISLVSRRDPEDTVDRLIRQCTDAFGLWWEASGAALAAGGHLRLFDLGSGGGLPAIVWLALLAERQVAVEAMLVEPRVKRAWFLERQAQLPGAPPFAVLAARWGERPVGAASAVGAGAPSVAGASLAAGAGARANVPILLTLKALRLPEAVVLAGLAAAADTAGPVAEAGCPIEIVRFQPATGISAAALAQELEIPAAGERFAPAPAGGRFESAGYRFLTPAASAKDAAGLLVSRHLAVAG